MRPIFAVLAALACLAGVVACSHSAAPPTGRWEGIYDSSDTMVAARLEITAKGDIYLSAPDATGIGQSADDDRAAIRQRMADGLAESWGDVQSRRLDFDGRTFRKPGGIAPQIAWDPQTGQMTLFVYLGTQPALHIALRPVKDFSADPFSNA